jgi:hypothetical protein
LIDDKLIVARHTSGGLPVSDVGDYSLSAIRVVLVGGGGTGGNMGVTISAGTSSAAVNLINFVNTNNVSFGLDGLNITASAAAITGLNVSAGNSSKNVAGFTFSNANGVSFGFDGTNVTGTVATNYQSQGAYLTTAMPANAATISNINVSAGATSNNLSALTFSNSNGLAFGLNGSVITGSYTVPAQNVPAFSADVSSTFQTLAFQNSNGISFSNNAGALRVTHDLQYTSATSAITANALNTSVARAANLMAATNNTGGGTASLSNNVSFTNANGLTFYSSAGNAIAGSYTVPSVAGLLSAVNISAGAASNNLSAVTFSNSNGLGFGLNGSVITGSYTVPSVAGLLSAINVSAGAASNNLSAITFSNSNGLGFGLNGSVITGSYTVPSVAGLLSAVNISAGATSNNLSAITFSNANGMAFGLNASTITASYSAPAMSRWTFPDPSGITFITAPANATASVNLIQVPDYLSGSRMELFQYQSLSSTASAVTYGQQWSIYMGIYSNDTANSRLVSISSGSTQTTYTNASNTAGVTNILLPAIRPISCPVNFNMTPGQYFVAANYVTNTFSSGAATTALNRTVSLVGGSIQSASFGMVYDYSAVTAVTANLFQPVGIFSAASTGLPASISHSQLLMTGANRLAANFAVGFRSN